MAFPGVVCASDEGAMGSVRIIIAHRIDQRASIRIPIYTVKHGWKGYLEDRRPASNADPYRATARIIETVREAHERAI